MKVYLAFGKRKKDLWVIYVAYNGDPREQLPSDGDYTITELPERTTPLTKTLGTDE